MRWVAVLVCVASSDAIAGGLVVSGGSPRTIGRAGVGLVGDDGGGALVVNPAAMARREGTRAQLGVTYIDDEIAWQSDKPDAPIARSQSPSAVAPTGSAITSFGAWVIGAGAMTTAVSDRSMRPPGDFPPDQLGVKFDFRYAGIAGGARRDTLTVGAARRIGDTFALGLAVAASRLAVTEVRRLWAGFDGRDRVGDPASDVEVAMSGSDNFVPSAVAGVLFAPDDSRLELGASVAVSGSAHVLADITGTGTRPMGPSVHPTSPVAKLLVRQPWSARVGGRYAGKRLVLEVDGELHVVPDAAESTKWFVRGIRIVDRTGLDVSLDEVPSRISLRTHGAARVGVDWELVPGFLWATAGYARTVGSVTGSRQSPVFGDLGGHTLAAGLEGSSGGFTFTFGWARTWSSDHHDASAFSLDNPFRAGTAPVQTGTYDGSSDQIGILVDFELDAPK